LACSGLREQLVKREHPVLPLSRGKDR
jgi:hypothetical protein